MRRLLALSIIAILGTASVIAVLDPTDPNNAVVASSETSPPVMAQITTSSSTTIPPTTVPPTTTTTRRVVTTAAPRPAPAPAPGPQASDDVWVRLAQCESGMTNANTGNGYYGYFQFLPSTWRSVGGTGLPHHHGWDEQVNRAKILQARSGWGQWPACSRKLGLR